MSDKGKKIEPLGQAPKPKPGLGKIPIGAVPMIGKVARPLPSIRLPAITLDGAKVTSTDKPEPAFKIIADGEKLQDKADDSQLSPPVTDSKILKKKRPVSHVDPSWADWDPNEFRIFVGDLGPEVTDTMLQAAFAPYGSSLTKARVVRDNRSGKSRGYGFVGFKEPDDFLKAMREMNGKYIGSRPVKLKKSTAEGPTSTSSSSSDQSNLKRRRK